MIEVRKEIWLIVTLVLITSITGYGQTSAKLLQGKVTYITSKNIYVRFDDTEVIQQGDTLWIEQNGHLDACLTVRQKSSTSCVCIDMNTCPIKQHALVYFKEKIEPSTEIAKDPASNLAKDVPADVPESKKDELDHVKGKKTYVEQIKGRLTAATYSYLSAEDEANHRMMYRFSMNADHLGGSNFSVQTYLNYRQNFVPTSQDYGQKTRFFRVYDLSVRYDVDSSMTILAGRHINPEASSLGAIDGLQAQKQFGQFYTGLIAGFRPDIYDFGFNPNLFEYGIYVGLRSTDASNYSKTTLGLLEHRNRGNIDRRYLYFQHSSQLTKKLNVFGSAELDIFQNVHGQTSKDARLTSLFVSLRYRAHRKLDFNASYDTRKRIIYYETFKTDIDRLLEDDEARQGFRLRVNSRPIKHVSTGISYAKRFQNSKRNKSDNINGNLSIAKVPQIGGRFSFNVNLNESSYLRSRILSFRQAWDIMKRKMNVAVNYRNVHYTYLNSEVQFNQAYYIATVSIRFDKKWMFGLTSEMANREGEHTYRFNTRLTRRFKK